MGPHKVGQAELVQGVSHKQGPAFGKTRHGLPGEVVVRYQAAAVCVSREGVVVQLAKDLVHVHGNAQQLLVLLEQVHPGVEVARAVVAVHHGYGQAVRGGNDVNHLIRL